MNKEIKKYSVVIFQVLLTLILFACNFVFVKMKYNASWWRGESVNGYQLIGSLKNFIGALYDIFAVLIIVLAVVCLVAAVFGILNSTGITKIKIGKLQISLLLKWMLFINLCFALLNIIWVLIMVSSQNAKYSYKFFKYAVSFTPFLYAMVCSVCYACYCVLDGKFIWVKDFWSNFGKKLKEKKASKAIKNKDAKEAAEQKELKTDSKKSTDEQENLNIAEKDDTENSDNE